MTSLSVRKVQEMAAAGTLPGAAKLGGVWTFDRRKVLAWIEEREAHAARPRADLSAGRYRTRCGRLDDDTPDFVVDEEFERLILKKGRKKLEAARKRSRSAKGTPE